MLSKLKSQLRIVGPLIAVTGIGLIVFQNCSNAQFTKMESASLSVSGQAVPTGGNPRSTPAPICDPFSTGSVCAAGLGLKGNLYYLAAYDTSSPRNQIADIITNGLLAPSQIIFSKLDIATRSWEDGFPGENGSIKNTDGTPLVEWFALDLKGMIRLDAANQPGEYQFALMSDDGSILDIDGTNVIDFDGQHGPSWKCAANKVSLAAGDLHSVRLRYFQGPRIQIALRLLWRSWAKNSEPCDDSGGFSPVPAFVLFN